MDMDGDGKSLDDKNEEYEIERMGVLIAAERTKKKVIGHLESLISTLIARVKIMEKSTKPEDWEKTQFLLKQIGELSQKATNLVPSYANSHAPRRSPGRPKKGQAETEEEPPSAPPVPSFGAGDVGG